MKIYLLKNFVKKNNKYNNLHLIMELILMNFYQFLNYI